MEEYIASFPENTQKVLLEVCEAIRSVVPEGTEELLAYGMPTFKYKKNLVHFAAWNNHLGFYPTPSGIREFQDQLSIYEGAKGSIKFLYSQPIPIDLIKQIVEFRVKEVISKSN
jgi:uncharacterized protein YdhG (YjbR/CyaY superfamily)